MNPERRRQSGPWQLLSMTVLAVAISASLHPALAEEETGGDLPGVMRFLDYRASVFSYRDQGTLLWLNGPDGPDGPDGMMRLEIRRGAVHANEPDPMIPLLEQTGEGWTVILGGETGGTVSAWGEQWRQPPAGLVRAAQLIAATLAAGPPAQMPVQRRWRAGAAPQSVAKYGIPSLTPTNSRQEASRAFRRALSLRGWGGGGDGDMLELAWQSEDEAEAPYLRIRSTRRPGEVEISTRTRHPVIYAMPEVFAPLWPMAELVTFRP